MEFIQEFFANHPGLVMAIQLILGLSLIVALHEAGHMFAAKAFGMRVEKFAIGFPPKIFGFTKGETEYMLGAIPLGGYVKISGMIDESMDTEAMEKEPEEWEFRAKPAWQRLIVMLGGIFVNVITGIFIYSLMNFTYGETFVPKDEFNKHGVLASDLAQSFGFQTGDKILALNGKDYQRFSDVINPEFLFAEELIYNIQRDGQKMDLTMPVDFLDGLAAEGQKNDTKQPFLSYRYEFSINEVSENTGSSRAGLAPGDIITSIAGAPVKLYDQFLAARDALGPNADMPITVNRGGKEIAMTITLDENGNAGFYGKPEINYSQNPIPFFASISKGTSDAFNVIAMNIKGFKKIFAGDVSVKNSVAGPIGIAKFFGGEWNWIRFWSNIAMISMILAFMNLLPIPALDGGHVVFLLYEIISGRAPATSVLEGAQKVGMLILLALMVFVIFNDINNFGFFEWVGSFF